MVSLLLQDVRLQRDDFPDAADVPGRHGHGGFRLLWLEGRCFRAR
jgi:hypothetical protein